MTFVGQYLLETASILEALDQQAIEKIADHLRDLKGRLFILGVGGSAATASHAVNDFRKVCGIEAYAPTDNVAELTARTNDDGWKWTFAPWLKTSNLCSDDAVFVLSVGGGSATVSPNLVEACDLAQSQGALILGVVGRDGGLTAWYADACLIIPPLYVERITPHTEGIASLIMHLLVEFLCN